MNYDIQTTYKDLPVSESRKEEQGQVVGTASLCPGSDNPAAAAAQDNSRLFKTGMGLGGGVVEMVDRGDWTGLAWRCICQQ